MICIAACSWWTNISISLDADEIRINDENSQEQDESTSLETRAQGNYYIH